MKPICFYHSADLDGVCSAAIVKHFVPDCVLYGIDYGEQFPWDLVRPGVNARNEPLWAHVFEPENGYEEGDNWEKFTWDFREVYMVDFSLPPADMKQLAEYSNRLIWIDHHSTAIAAAIDGGYSTTRGGCAGVQTSAFAACELVWKWFKAMEHYGELGPTEWSKSMIEGSVPEAVRLLGIYDSWRSDDPDWDSEVLPFQYGCRSAEGVYNPEGGCWRHLLSEEASASTAGPNSVEQVIEVGAGILQFQKQQCAKIAEAGAFYAHVEDPGIKSSEGTCGFYTTPGTRTQVMSVRAICLNTPIYNSQSFESVYDPEKHDVMVPFAKMADGRWKVSLYSTKPEVDCGAIAKTFGGGGHKGAAGFICYELPWEPNQ